jgi:putative MATE family efflux protein
MYLREELDCRASLTHGCVKSILVRMTWPTAWGLFSIVGLNLADMYFLGLLGGPVLTSISYTIPIIMIIAGLTIGLGSGTASVISRAIGRGDNQRVRRLATDSLILALLIVGLVVVAGISTILPLFSLLGAGPELLPLIEDYMSIWYLATGFLVIPMVGNAIIRARGDTRFPALIMTFSAMINLILDPILIFGFWGIPALGIKGAALATMISRALTIIPSLYILHYRERILDFSAPKIKEVFQSWKEILYVGLPSAGSNIIAPVTLTIITSLLSGYGSEAVAAFGIVNRLEAFFFIIIIALSSVVGPFVGQNWGAKKLSRVRLAFEVSCIFTLIYGLSGALLLGFMGEFIASLFSQSLETISVAATYLWIVPASYAFEGIRMMANSSFIGLGRPLPATLLMTLRMFILYIPLAYGAAESFGIHGIFFATFFSNFSVGILSYIWITKVCKKRN